MTASVPPPPAAVPVPDLGDYRRALAVVEAAARAKHLQELRETTLDAIAEAFGCRDLTFFVGTSLEDAFQDREPVVAGKAARMVDAYRGRYWRHDVFARASVMPIYRRRSAVRLCELPAPEGPEDERYVREFLTEHGIVDELAIKLDAGPGGCALIGLLSDRAGRFGAHDVAAAQLLSGPIAGVLRFHLQAARRCAPRQELSRREAEVAGLVADGYSNREIAEQLFISQDTVKKHLSKALAAYGCNSRTQLAIAWRAA